MDKTYKHGIVLGKFMPLHLGHEHLIQTGISHCEKLTVVVCTLTREPIPGWRRVSWMRNRFEKEIREGNVTVVHLKEDWIPQEPEDCYSREIFFAVWAAVLKVLAKDPINVIFTSEDYGYPVADALGCEHFLVDKGRVAFPVSGTRVRNHPEQYLQFLNEEVQKYYTLDVSEYDQEDLSDRS